MSSPFLRLNSVAYADILADCAVDLLRDRGVDGLSVAAIARRMKVTPPAVLQAAGSRARVLELIVIAFGPRWLAWSARPERYDDPLPVRLPATEEDAHGVRVWCALAELARGEMAKGSPATQALLDRFRDEERAMLAYELGRRLDRPAGEGELDRVSALASGLQVALSAPRPMLTLDRAKAALTTLMTELTR